MLALTRDVWLEMVGHAYDGLPDEACGFLEGDPEASQVSAFYRCRNAARSSRVYEIDRKDFEAAEDDAESRGLPLLGVMHSHTHTEAYPSPTDVEKATDLEMWYPDWRYVIVSLKRAEPVLRSYRIQGGEIQEEPVIVRAAH